MHDILTPELLDPSVLELGRRRARRTTNAAICSGIRCAGVPSCR